MAYPSFYRKKVLAYRKKHGATIQETAEHFKIGTASVSRWVHKKGPAKTRMKKPTKITDKALLKDVKKYPDAYQYERAERLGASKAGICYALKRLKITYKKNSATSKSKRKGTYKIQKEN